MTYFPSFFPIFQREKKRSFSFYYIADILAQFLIGKLFCNLGQAVSLLTNTLHVNHLSTSATVKTTAVVLRFLTHIFP